MKKSKTLIDNEILKQRISQLEERNNRLELIMNNCQLGSWDWNLLTDEIYFSPQWKTILGYGENKKLKNIADWKKLIHPEDKEKVFTDIKMCLNGTTTSYKNELRVIDKDQNYRWLRNRAKIISWTAEGKPARMISTFTDITEIKKNEEMINTKKDFAENLLETANSMIITLDTKGNISSFNKFSEKLTGYTKEEVLGKNWFEIFLPKNDKKSLLTVFTNTINAAEHTTFKNFIITKNGEQRLINWNNNKIKNQSGKVNGILSIGIDITTHYKNEREIAAKQKINELLLNTMPHPIMMINKKRIIIAANKKALDLGITAGGYCWNEFGKSKYLSKENMILAKKNPNDPKIQCTFCKMDEMFQTNKATHDPCVNAFGRFWATHWIPINNNEYLHYAIDITEQEKTKEALAASEEKFKSVIKSMDDLIFVLDKEDKFTAVYANQKELLLKPAFFIGKKHGEILPKEVDQLYKKAIINVKKGKTEEYDYSLEMPDGTQWFDLKLSPLLKNGKFNGSVSVIRNITDRKQAEIKLKKQLDFIKFTNKLSTEFINIDESLLDKTLTKLLKLTVKFTETDRGYLFLFTENREQLKISHEWCRDDVKPRTGDLKIINLKKEPFEDLINSLKENDIIQLNKSDFEKNPEYSIILKNLNLLNIKSFIALPIIVKKQLIGLVGFETTSKEVEWSTQAIDSFHLCKTIITNTFGKNRADKEIKNYTASQETLLREVNHRVKNNLYAISGLLTKEKNKIKKIGSPVLSQFIDDLDHRVGNLLTIHSLLSASKWQPINLAILCENIATYLLEDMIKKGQVSLTVTSTKVMVNSFQVQQIALVTNEIITNTIKYCRPQNKKIIINIDITFDEKQIDIIIKDNGDGFTQKLLDNDFSEIGIGFDLIYGIVKKSLGGSVLIKNDNGAVLEIKMKRMK